MSTLPSGPMLSDEELAERVMQGSSEAFTLLFERYRSPIYRFCLLMLGDRAIAEDIYQETFLALYRACCIKDEAIRNVRAYLLTVARRRCLNHLRSNNRHVPLEDEVPITYEMNMELLDLNEILQQALLEIPSQYRESFLLFEMEGFTYKEIALSLQINADVVRNRIHRAKKALQKILDPIFDIGNSDLGSK